MALRPDATKIPRKQMIKFLTPSGRGPGAGLCGTADGYSPDIAQTGTLRLRLRLCHKYNNLNSSIQMYIMSTNAEYTEMTIAKLLVEASARNQRCLECKLSEQFRLNWNPIFIIHGSRNALKCITKFRSKLLHGTYAAWNPCNMVHSKSLILDPRMRLSAIAKLPAGWRFTTEPTSYELKNYNLSFQYFSKEHWSFVPKCPASALARTMDPWISGTDSVPLKPL